MKHLGRAPAPVLVKNGPLVGVTIGLHPTAAGVLTAQGKPLPSVQVVMMVDTGAERTVIERRIAEQVGLTYLRDTPMIGVSGKPEDCPVYLAQITIAVGDGERLGAFQFNAEVIGMSSPPQPMPHVGLIGRDFLTYFQFTYDGLEGQFGLTVHPRVQPILFPKAPALVPMPPGQGSSPFAAFAPQPSIVQALPPFQSLPPIGSPSLLPPAPMSKDERDKLRKKRKAERQSRKKNRRRR